MNSCISPAARRLRAIAVVGAIGLAAAASTAWAQGGQGEKSGQGGKSASHAAAAKPAAVGGVVVQAPPKTTRIPPDKKAALDAEAAKRKAWQKYRTTTPAPTPTRTAGVGASERAENYPGLRTLPH